jgi:hypothetical protein
MGYRNSVNAGKNGDSRRGDSSVSSPSRAMLLMWLAVLLTTLISAPASATPLADNYPTDSYDNDDWIDAFLNIENVYDDGDYIVGSNFVGSDFDGTREGGNVEIFPTKRCRTICSMATAPTVSPTSSLSPTLEEEEDSCDGTTADIPRFLFAGQSNMIGHSNEAKEGLFDETISYINKKWGKITGKKRKRQKRKRKKKILANLTEAFRTSQGTTNTSSEAMAKKIWKLAGNKKGKSVLNDKTITVPHPKNVCSFTNPSQGNPPPRCEVPISPSSCGASTENYGLELVFSQQFPKLKNTGYTKKTIGITKVAVGGTKIDQWVKPGSANFATQAPNYWESLYEAIHADHGTVEAFVWFQGENDHFPVETPKEIYLAYLKKLVSDVRHEIYETYQQKRKRDGIALKDSLFFQKEDIPVVIIELGCWIGNGVALVSPGNIISAQIEFVKE